ncbi:hypothetical protein SBOR_9889 [Sclerotinia borealis F-4128]|uniref:Uncharacterized protein n=1 Tax=Sclerotinia borealis (strain F-4128) TaxID=1432307 RepID=W9C1F0_SCLBF|nr:hypothetical protein SBOR_9889 [Sclerotinia borealis F-4128]
MSRLPDLPQRFPPTPEILHYTPQRSTGKTNAAETSRNQWRAHRQKSQSNLSRVEAHTYPQTMTVREGFIQYWADISHEEMVALIPGEILPLLQKKLRQLLTDLNTDLKDRDRASKPVDFEYEFWRYWTNMSDKKLVNLVKEMEMMDVIKEEARREFMKGDGHN